METIPAISLKNISKSFRSKDNSFHALKGVSMEVAPGEIYGVIGQSGAGKSTLVRCINLLETPESGEILVDGVNLLSLTDKELRKIRTQIGMIFQQFNLLMQSTVLENVCFPLLICGVSKQKARERALELLEVVGLTDKKASYPAQLSGGQKQRVAIARALANNPKILLCDEATSALDNATTNEILELLQKINTELGVTIIIITHEMKVVERVCTKVSVIDAGEIVETSEVAELFSSPKTAAAKRLILAKETAPESITPKSNRFRIVFGGSVSEEPIISNMVLNMGIMVNILHANLQDVGGYNFGQMVIELPEDEEVCRRAKEYLESKQIVVEGLQ